jgi:hypothetical protein
MKRFLLITAIVLATFGCERHSADELTPELGAPTPRPPTREEQKGSGSELKWDITGIATLGLVGVTLLSVWLALRTERVFTEIKKTLDKARTRSEEAIRVQIMMTCMEQFQDLENKVSDKKVKADRYFEILWNLHFAEYQFFRRGFLPEDVYGLWLLVRNKDYKADKRKDDGIIEDAGWNHAKEYLGDKQFTNFVESWLKAQQLSMAEVQEILSKVPRSTGDAPRT